MVGITAKRTAIHRTRRRQEGEDFGELSRAAPAEPSLNGLKPGSLPIAGRGYVARTAPFRKDLRPPKQAERSGRTKPSAIDPTPLRARARRRRRYALARPGAGLAAT